MDERDLLTALVELRASLGLERPFSVENALLVELPTPAGDDTEGRAIVDRGDLLSVDSFARRFEQLQRERPPWINLSFLGEVEGIAIVSVEIPGSRRGGGTSAPSLNFSGPPAGGIDRAIAWRARPDGPPRR